MLADILKQKRKQLGLTQTAIAQKLNVQRQTVSNWENDKSYPDIPTLVRISKLYDLSLDYMLKGDEQYMKQVKKDYRLINKRKKDVWLDRLLIVGLTVGLSPLLWLPFVKSDEQSKWIGVFMMVCVTAMFPLSYLKLKSFYHGDSKNLFVPKSSGVGLTINPNHPLGKLVWIILTLIMVYMIIQMIITPD